MSKKNRINVLADILAMVVSLSMIAGDSVAQANESDTGKTELMAGVAVVDITPPKGWRMSGYFRERINTGTHDPLKAKAMVLAQGDRQAALVFCDLSKISLNVSDQARRLASRRTGIPQSNIVIAATHTHTGPLYFDALRNHFHQRVMNQHGNDPYEPFDYSAILVKKLVEVISEARTSAKPTLLEVGKAEETRLSFNRRFHMKDGTVRFNPGRLNPRIVRPAGPVDPHVGILLLRDANSRRAIAALTVFALHTATTGGTEYSADYPYYLEHELRKITDDKFVSIFGIGTCGDVNHIDVKIKTKPSARQIGTRLAETVRNALPKLCFLDSPSLAIKSAKIAVPMQQYNSEQVVQAAQSMDKVATRKLPFLKRVEAYKIMDLQLRKGPLLPLEVQVFRFGNDLAIVTLPGEVFVELGLAIKKASPFKNTLVIELANDAPGYIPTQKAFAEGSYETVNSRIRSGGGEMMVETAVRLLKELAE
ncbi:MAG: neutral/alkaline non-lysosomal ceramidase N-terminal domain-containing protein [Planctomycetota bacterium]|nr:MAG: neutral/alkaline non-lysosomal ceramidase N-terminal domain-containing protein [Planctomycetota bacterium]